MSNKIHRNEEGVGLGQRRSLPRDKSVETWE